MKGIGLFPEESDVVQDLCPQLKVNCKVWRENAVDIIS